MPDDDMPDGDLITPALLARLRDPLHPRLLVGFSGGVDSHVLLHALCQHGLADKVQALHVNHGISPHADSWQAHCQAVCAQLGVVCQTVRLQLPAAGNLEQAARRGRYQAFAAALNAGDLLLLGHHQDDQVETALFYLLRGSGSLGLQGMPAERALGQARLLRPLLGRSREQIEQYAQAQGLAWIEDESNQDLLLTRNYLRRQLIPDLQRRWPQLSTSLMQSLQRDAQAREYISEIAASDLAALCLPQGGLDLPGFIALGARRQKFLLSHWLGRLQLPFPSAEQFGKALPALLGARQDRVPAMHWQGITLTRFGQALYLLRPMTPLQDSGPQQLGIAPLPWQGGLLEARMLPNGLRVDDPARFEVRRRQGGERLRRTRSQTLKNLLQASGVPPWLRDRLPLIYRDNELVAVAGLPAWDVPTLVASQYQAPAGQAGLHFAFSISDHYAAADAGPGE